MLKSAVFLHARHVGMRNWTPDQPSIKTRRRSQKVSNVSLKKCSSWSCVLAPPKLARSPGMYSSVNKNRIHTSVRNKTVCYWCRDACVYKQSKVSIATICVRLRVYSVTICIHYLSILFLSIVKNCLNAAMTPGTELAFQTPVLNHCLCNLNDFNHGRHHERIL